MKAVSLWQPWASLWCSPRKIHETRGRTLRYRGWLAVHAAKFDACRDIVKHQTHEQMAPLVAILEDEYGGHWSRDLPRGAIIGAVNIIDCLPTQDVVRARIESRYADIADLDDATCGNFEPGRFAWRRGEFKLLPQPVPYRGMQSLFDVPDDLFKGLIEVKA